jgi:DNA-directed RNA polymerase subunit RPC12/RpoP
MALKLLNRYLRGGWRNFSPKPLDKSEKVWYNIYNKEREGNEMKCPNCGSSAQVRLVWQDKDLLTRRHYMEFKCGCGSRFMATYELIDIEVIKNDGDT